MKIEKISQTDLQRHIDTCEIEIRRNTKATYPILLEEIRKISDEFNGFRCTYSHKLHCLEPLYNLIETYFIDGVRVAYDPDPDNRYVEWC